MGIRLSGSAEKTLVRPNGSLVSSLPSLEEKARMALRLVATRAVLRGEWWVDEGLY